MAMYKVLIIDDDPLIRRGLSSILNWNELGFALAGEGKDGQEGLDLFRSLRPDLILTDIKMPHMDGLEMISRIRKEDRKVQIIVITAFRDFEYAKRALSSGVSDLILKPTKIDELSEAVRTAGKFLDRRVNMDKELQRQKQLFQENIPLLKEKFLHDLIFGIERPDGSEKERMELFGLDLSLYHIMIIRFTEAEGQSNYNLYLRQIGISRLMNRIFGEEINVQKIQFRTIQSAYLITGEQNQLLPLLRRHSEELIQSVKSSIGLDISIGLSSAGRGIENLSKCFNQASRALEKVFFTGSSIVLEDREERTDPAEGIMDMEDLILAIGAGNRDKVNLWFDDFYDDWAKSDFSVEKSKKICGEIFWKLVNSNGTSSLSARDTMTTFQSLFNSSGFDQTVEIIRKLALESVGKISSLESESISGTVEKCKDYINAHYNEQISLTSAAEAVYVSSSYLSRIFPQETGVGFSEYLSGVRIAKAEELLRETEWKSYKIAAMVGFQDPHYFSRVFKKATGLSPSQFRQREEVTEI